MTGFVMINDLEPSRVFGGARSAYRVHRARDTSFAFAGDFVDNGPLFLYI